MWHHITLGLYNIESVLVNKEICACAEGNVYKIQPAATAAAYHIGSTALQHHQEEKGGAKVDEFQEKMLKFSFFSLFTPLPWEGHGLARGLSEGP